MIKIMTTFYMGLRIPVLALLALCLVSMSLPVLAAQRVPDLTAAKERLVAGEADALAVLLHGSDWCPAGERIKAGVWDTEVFAASLPTHLLLCAVDHLDAGTPKLGTAIQDELEGQMGMSISSSVPVAANGTLFTRLEDGSWQVQKGSPNPATEVMTIQLELEQAAALLRLTTLTAPELPGKGPGRARNGNLVITEVELRIDGQAVQLWATSPHDHKSLRPGETVDGILSPTNGWDLDGRHEDFPLYLVPVTPLPSGTEIELKIHSLHQSKQHTLGRFKLDAFAGLPASVPTPAARKAERTHMRNGVYKVATSNYPSLRLLDQEGKALGAYEPVPHDAAAGDVIEKIISMLRTRTAWEAHQAAAEKVEGETRLEALAQAWILMREAGAGDYYKAVEKKMLELDPERKSAWTWRVTPDAKTMSAEQKRLTAEESPQAAADYIDRMLADPRLQRLTPQQRQDMVLRKFHIYRAAPELKEKRFEVLEEIRAIDSTTHLAIGAKGYIDMHREADITMGFGWKAGHLKVGDQQLDIRDGVPIRFHRAGYYKVVLATAGSKQPVTVHSLALLSGDQLLSTDAHEATLMHKADKDNCFKLELPGGVDPDTLSLRIHLNAPEGHEHRCNGISVTPYIPADGPFGWQ